MTDCITLPLRTVVDGRIWQLYSYEYQTPDGKFCGYLHAVPWNTQRPWLATSEPAPSWSG